MLLDKYGEREKNAQNDERNHVESVDIINVKKNIIRLLQRPYCSYFVHMYVF